MAKRRADRQSWLILIAGLFMTTIGAAWLLSGSDDCGGSAMSAGDTCETYTNGELTGTTDAAGQRAAHPVKGGARGSGDRRGGEECLAGRVDVGGGGVS
ncbi:hypothetical protein, partial [Actinoplanes sp. NPDC051851]|uniref:hypothetical protein n=1 Tax=Actinoplanes sp. NPDC051851 TaxID=3154753 RepID=UPI00341EB453